MEKTRFIVRARSEESTLNDFLTMIENSPELAVVDTIGPAGRPHTAVIAVDAQHAPSFEQRFSDQQQQIIERDRPLSLLDKTRDFLHRSERNTHA